MAKTMRAGVVHAFGKPLSIEEIPDSDPGAGRGSDQGRCERRLSHRPACRRRRLAGKAFAAVCPRP